MNSKIPRPVSSTNFTTRSVKTSRATSIASDEDEEVLKVIEQEIRQQITVGERVIIPSGKTGTLRYLGLTQFKQGEWAGIELDCCTGLNDGSVNEVRYFDCEPGYGIFVPIRKVKQLNCQTPRHSSSRPCSTTPSLSGKSSFKSKSITSSPNSMTTTSNLVIPQKRQTKRYTGEKYQTEALHPKLLNSNTLKSHPYTSSVITDQNVSMINILMLERDKAISTIDKLKQQVEDLDFELEEEKARRTEKKVKSTLDAIVQVNINDPELNDLYKKFENLNLQHNTLLSRVKSYDLSVEAIENLSKKMEIDDEAIYSSNDLSKMCSMVYEQFTQKQVTLDNVMEKNKHLLQEKEKMQEQHRQLENELILQMSKVEDRLQREITNLKDNVIINMELDLKNKDDVIEEQQRKIQQLEEKVLSFLQTEDAIVCNKTSSNENLNLQDRYNTVHKTDETFQSNDFNLQLSNEIHRQKELPNYDYGRFTDAIQKCGGSESTATNIQSDISGNNTLSKHNTPRTSDIISNKFLLNNAYDRSGSDSFNNGLHLSGYNSRVSDILKSTQSISSYTPNYFGTSRYTSALHPHKVDLPSSSSRWYTNYPTSNSLSVNGSVNSTKSMYPSKAMSPLSNTTINSAASRATFNSFKSRYT